MNNKKRNVPLKINVSHGKGVWRVPVYAMNT